MHLLRLGHVIFDQTHDGFFSIASIIRSLFFFLEACRTRHDCRRADIWTTCQFFYLIGMRLMIVRACHCAYFSIGDDTPCTAPRMWWPLGVVVTTPIDTILSTVPRMAAVHKIVYDQRRG